MSIEAHFDGEVFVPDGAVDMPVGQKVRVEVRAVEPQSTESARNGPDFEAILEKLSKFPVNENWPVDGARQVDHYLYGTPKVP